jgi:hypothetical protein
MPGKLWENTREWHHKCETHPVGAAMSAGNPNPGWYRDWLVSLLVIHSKIDPYIPECARRTTLIAKDLELMEGTCKLPRALLSFLAKQLLEDELGGFAYVLTGAHLMGGEIMRRRLEGYPTNHLVWEDRKESLLYLQSLRDREEYTSGALECFELLYNCMENIYLES